MKHVFVITLILIFSTNIFSQSPSLFIPRDVRKAYEKGTRSYDGTVSEKYWINHNDYKIDAELIPDSNIIVGSEEIIFHNESPDSLSEIVIRLYQNITKAGVSRDRNIPESALTKGVEISKLKIQDSLIDVNSKYVRIFGTNMTVKLQNKLAPNSSVKLEIDWKFEISKIPIRMGNFNGDYFIGYWYPQVSVYDDVFGWDEIQYSGTVEFYDDFNNYEVNITVPDDYVVWGTGDLQNINDLFQKNIIDKIEEAKNSDETINIITLEDYKNNKVILKKGNGKNTWKFKAAKVPDVAWAASNHYNWDASSIEVEKGRRVLTAAVYPDSIEQYKNGALYARETIKYMSQVSPGYPYPWSHTTAFCNKSHGGGMEFPMMQNNGAPKSIGSTVGLIFHEIAHNYFPFYMGTNERRAAWMDEGWASFFPRRVVEKYDSTFDYQAYRVAAYVGEAGNYKDMPMILPSYMMTRGEIRNNFYNRPANAYEELRNLLGDDLFYKALREYISRWHEKHPIPYDFFFTFDDVVGEDLSWFWKPWFFELGYPDLGINDVEIDGNNLTLTIKKVGNIPTRIAYTLIYDDDTKENFTASAFRWKNGDYAIFKHSLDRKLKKIILGDYLIPDVNQKNDVFVIK